MHLVDRRVGLLDRLGDRDLLHAELEKSRRLRRILSWRNEFWMDKLLLQAIGIPESARMAAVVMIMAVNVRLGACYPHPPARRT